MTKKELIATLASVDDNADVLFGTNQLGMFGAFATRVYYCEDGNGVVICFQFSIFAEE